MAKAKQGKKLIIVESPHKAKIIQKFLGEPYLAMASIGHIRDLPKSGRGKQKLGIDVDNNYAMSYEIITGKEKIIQDLKQAAKKAEFVYLAPDPDREGEAIAWHLQQALELPQEKTKRITYQAVTKKAVLDALEHARDIDIHLVNAQQTRRALDRLVGFNLSPFLWKKIAKSLSAGRVQSPAVRMIVEREKDIKSFISQEYWTIKAQLQPEGIPEHFVADLVRWQNKKFDLQHTMAKSEASAQTILASLAQISFVIESVETKESKASPRAPFITSTLQQAGNIILKYSAQRTMRLAQSLYEGIELDGVATGLITYMRTDSTHVDASAVQEARDYLQHHHDKRYIPIKPRVYGSSNKNAQEAHEAIRPVSVHLTPSHLKDVLKPDEWRLYDLIWRRFMQSQMTDALYENTVVTIQAGEGVFEARGRTLVFDGFLVLDKRGDEDGEAKGEQYLPNMHNKPSLQLLQLLPEQHFTKPSPRYNEASLVKALEKEGIGRPSTYAPIIQTILERGYVIQKERAFYATELGMAVHSMLEKYFHNIVDYQFTANMENQLDKVETGEVDWVKMLDDFYRPFANEVTLATEQAEDLKGRAWEGTEHCPLCHGTLVVRYSTKGAFLSCKNYPECRGTVAMPGQVGDDDTENGSEAPVVQQELTCPQCSKPMVLKKSRFGMFYACTGYPDCKTTVSSNKAGQPVELPKVAEQSCEKCGKPMVVKMSKRGPFLACSGYPQCKNALSLDKDGQVVPTAVQVQSQEVCEKCGKPMVVKHSRRGDFLACSGYPECKSTKPMSKSNDDDGKIS